MTTTTYLDYGLRTRQHIYWATIFFGFLGLNAVIFNYTRTHDVFRMLTACGWVVGVILVTFRHLRELAALERTYPEPTNEMRLVFRVLAAFPILGIVPVIFGLR